MTSHGRYGTPEYTVWRGMIQRCENPTAKQYENYGGRGIRVCSQWRKFENFFADMGARPEGCTIERIQNDGHYEPGNCRWATRAEQSQNTRQTVFIDCYGERMSLLEASKRFCVPVRIISQRLSRGWPVNRAIEEPVGAVKAELRRMNAERREREAFAEAAE